MLTGKRGGFGAMKPIMRLIRDDAELNLQLVVTDQHVNKRFGNTLKEIEQEFAIVAAVDMEQVDDQPRSRAYALGVCLQKMSDVLSELKPDICVLYGDRGEVLVTAIAATMLNIPIAHIQGGDLSGSLDEQMRHAVTKLAHLHFTSNAESAGRIRKMGEEEWRIHVVGDNHIDLIVAGEFAPPQEVARCLDLEPEKPIIVVLQHSETTAPNDSYEQMVETLIAVKSTGHQVVVVHPCSDQGYGGVIRAVNDYTQTPQFRVRVNLDAPIFWGLLNIASVMVGNSSAGLIETPSFHLPAINIGRRQEGRMHSENVLHVGHDRHAIAQALDITLNDMGFQKRVANCRQPYGDGLAAKKIVATLKKIRIDDKLLVKRMQY